MGTRSAAGRAGNGVNTVSPGPPTAPEALDQFDERDYGAEMVYSGSEQDSDSGEEEDAVASGGDRRGVKRERSEREVGHQAAPAAGAPAGGYSGVPGAKPGKKTRGRVKIKMEFIDNKLRRYTTFSKRKTGIMKKVSGGQVTPEPPNQDLWASLMGVRRSQEAWARARRPQALSRAPCRPTSCPP